MATPSDYPSAGLRTGNEPAPEPKPKRHVSQEARQNMARAQLSLKQERFVREYASAQDEHRVLTEDVRFLDGAERARVLAAQRRVVAAFGAAISAVRPTLARNELAQPLAMLLFGIINWMFDPTELQEYPRGLEIPEIHSDGYDVQTPCGILRGDPQEIEGVVRTSYGCFGVKTRNTWSRIHRNGRCT